MKTSILNFNDQLKEPTHGHRIKTFSDGDDSIHRYLRLRCSIVTAIELQHANSNEKMSQFTRSVNVLLSGNTF